MTWASGLFVPFAPHMLFPALPWVCNLCCLTPTLSLPQPYNQAVGLGSLPLPSSLREWPFFRKPSGFGFPQEDGGWNTPSWI